MQQMFGTNNHYIQDDGCGHGILFVILRPVNSGENTGVDAQHETTIPVFLGFTIQCAFVRRQFQCS